MRLGIVGGLDRNAHHYEGFARDLGHSIECHGGHLAGTGAAALETLVLRSDLVVVCTDVNSHAAVWRAKRLARQHGRPCVLVRRLGISRLERLLGASRDEAEVHRALARSA
jgi:hypothetical protein